MKIVSIGDNLHEISKPVFLEKNKKNIIYLSSAEIAHSVVKVNKRGILKIGSSYFTKKAYAGVLIRKISMRCF